MREDAPRSYISRDASEIGHMGRVGARDGNRFGKWELASGISH